MYQLVFPILFALSALASAQITPVKIETRGLDEIYAAAQRESGPLIVASGGDAKQQGDAVVEAFESRFPGISLSLTVDLSKYHDSRIDRAFSEGNETTDVAILQTLHDFPHWKEQGRLLKYKPAVWDDIYAAERDQDGAFLPVGVYGFGTIYYDNTKVNASEVPSSYEEFIDPKWRGRLVLTYPNDDDAVAYLFSLIVSRYGWEWLDALAANDVQWVRGTYSPVAMIQEAHSSSSDFRSVTFTTGGVDSSLTWFASQAIQAPEQSMTWPQTAAIFASTKRPETAKLLLSFLVSGEWQNATAGLGAPTARRSLDSYGIYEQKNNQPSGFRVFMNDRRTVDWWKLQFETSLGPAQGVSPLEIY